MRLSLNFALLGLSALFSVKAVPTAGTSRVKVAKMSASEDATELVRRTALPNNLEHKSSQPPLGTLGRIHSRKVFQLGHLFPAWLLGYRTDPGLGSPFRREHLLLWGNRSVP